MTALPPPSAASPMNPPSPEQIETLQGLYRAALAENARLRERGHQFRTDGDKQSVLLGVALLNAGGAEP